VSHTHGDHIGNVSLFPNSTVLIQRVGDVAHSEENFAKDIVPSLNTDKAASIASVERVRQMIATYQAKLFINHDKAQSDLLKLLPAFYD
jgi:N-acyl homoserine lactone hydrolase